MAHLTISVPERHVDDLRRVLTRAHDERVTALARAVDTYRESHEGLDAIDGAVVELHDLHDAIEQLGWQARPTPGPIELTAHPELLADALRALGEGAP